MNRSELAGAPAGAPYNSILSVARTLAVQAAARIMVLRQTPLIREGKPDHSLVTNADHESDRILRDGLHKAFPDHAILTEESGLLGSASAQFVWLIDPLDGTKAYAQGIKGFSVLVGLLKEGKPYLGVVVDPLEGYVYSAVRGEGAFCQQNGGEILPAKVSKRSDFSMMPVVTSTGFPEALHRPIREKLSGPWIPAVNSVGVKVGWIVRQFVDIYINHHPVHYWDTCAPLIILEEAGGVMTSWDGEALRYGLGEGTYQHRGPTLATNGMNHKVLLEIIESAKRPPA